MGVEDFDVAAHRPHPPGYPVYVTLARATTAAVAVARPRWDRDHVAAAGLALVGAIAGALAIPVFAAFWRAAGLAPLPALAAAILAVAAPLFWLTSSRPLSDTAGLVAAVAAQALLVRELMSIRVRASGLSRIAIAGALLAGLAVGVRSQTAWMTGPLALWLIGLLMWQRRMGDAARLTAAAGAGAAIWAVPLVWVTGGLSAYLKALDSQSREDFQGVEMLATSPSWALFTSAMTRTFIDPWQVKTLAHVVLGLAVIGLASSTWRRRPLAGIVIVAFLPYLVLHLAFQETVTARYALPLLVPVAGLAVAGLAVAGSYAVTIGVTGLVAVSLVLAVPRLDQYVRDGAPVVRAFRDMRVAWERRRDRPVLAMHHQVWWGVRRVMDWYRPVWKLGPQPFPGDREWLGVVEHFRSGQTRPVWFLAHPTRPGLPMFDPRALEAPRVYAFPRDLRPLIGGARLDSVVWHAVREPGWMVARGWALTPELGGITAQDREASRLGATEAFVRRRAGPHRLLVGGRYLGPDDGPPIDVTVSIDGRLAGRLRAVANPRWFFQWIDVPDGLPAGNDPYARLVVDARLPSGGDGRALVGLEQFDAAPAEESMFAFAAGWHESEANPATGLHWRWTSARSVVEIRGRDRDRRLVMGGESPLRYFDRAPTVTVRAGDRVLGTFRPGADFVETIDLPAAAVAAAGGIVSIETDQTFRPSDTGSPDQRALGLRLTSFAIQ